MACIIPAIASFLVDIKWSAQPLGDLHSQQLQQCVRALWSMREMWHVADSACQLVGQMMRSSQVVTARTLGMQSAPIPQADTSEESSEGSETRHLTGATRDPVAAAEERRQAEGLHGQALLQGLSIPAPDIGSVFLNFGNNSTRPSDEFAWTSAEFGFCDDFALPDGGMCTEPLADDHCHDPVYHNYTAAFTFTGTSAEPRAQNSVNAAMTPMTRESGNLSDGRLAFPNVRTNQSHIASFKAPAQPPYTLLTR
jgi:hypothetical protein